MPIIKEEDKEHSLADVPMGDDDTPVKGEHRERPLGDIPTEGSSTQMVKYESSSNTAMVKTEAQSDPSSSIAEDQGELATNMPTKWNSELLGTILGIRSEEVLRCLSQPSRYQHDAKTGKTAHFISFRDYCFDVTDLPFHEVWPCTTAGIRGRRSRTGIALQPSDLTIDTNQVTFTPSDPKALLSQLSQLGKADYHKPETWGTTLTERFNDHRAKFRTDRYTWNLGSIPVTYTNPKTDKIESCNIIAALVNNDEQVFNSVLDAPTVPRPLFPQGMTDDWRIFGTKSIMAALDAQTDAQSGSSTMEY